VEQQVGVALAVALERRTRAVVGVAVECRPPWR
jgi:hypothetical protein